LNRVLVDDELKVNSQPMEWHDASIYNGTTYTGMRRMAYLGVIDFSKPVTLTVAYQGHPFQFSVPKPPFTDPTYHGSIYQSAPRFWGRLFVDKGNHLWLRLQPTYEGGEAHLDIPGETIK
jgi:hypothetical protein